MVTIRELLPVGRSLPHVEFLKANCEEPSRYGLDFDTVKGPEGAEFIGHDYLSVYDGAAQLLALWAPVPIPVPE